MKREIQKNPYNAKMEEKTQIFFSDQICEQLVIIIFKNGQFLYLIKNKLTQKKKAEIAFKNQDVKREYERMLKKIEVSR